MVNMTGCTEIAYCKFKEKIRGLISINKMIIIFAQYQFISERSPSYDTDWIENCTFSEILKKSNSFVNISYRT